MKVNNAESDRLSFLSAREKIPAVFLSIGAVFFIGFVFYGSFFPGLFLAVPAVLLGLRLYAKRKKKQRKRKAEEEFLKAVLVFSDYLRSGYSSENAVKKTGEELISLYGSKSSVTKGFHEMSVQIGNGVPTEDAWDDFAEKEDVKSITGFATVFRMVKRRGGQLADVIELTASNLSERFRAEEQIETAITAKKTEARIMIAILPAMLLFVKISAPEMTAPLYGNSFGILFMTVMLIAYLFAIFVSEKTVRITE